MERIGIIGCGWFGKALAEHLIGIGYKVNGSTTTEEKVPLLEKEGINAYILRLDEQILGGRKKEFFRGIESLIVAFPPGLRKNKTTDYPKRISILKEEIAASDVKHVIFISSTAVYQDTHPPTVYQENDTEEVEPEDMNPLLVAENLLRVSNKYSCTILRFGGLIGPERHPVNFLSGKKNIPNPDAPVNLVHLDDCIGSVIRLLEYKRSGTVFNVVFPDHPSRKDYYLGMAKEKGLKAPEFDHSSSSAGKIISSTKLREELQYRFTHPI